MPAPYSRQLSDHRMADCSLSGLEAGLDLIRSRVASRIPPSSSYSRDRATYDPPPSPSRDRADSNNQARKDGGETRGKAKGYEVDV